MARRRKSTAEDLVEIVSYFHWGVGVSLAVATYSFLHWYAGQELPIAKDMHDISSQMLSGIFHGVANIGQYLFPVILLFGAGISFFNRRKRSSLYENTKISTAGNPLENMSWQDFELLIGEHFRREGYNVHETTGGADGGVDLVLKKDGARYLVQCKQWKTNKVGVKVVRELLGVMVGKGASGGFVVTSGQFTSDAIRFADENNIQLIDGGRLKSIISNTPITSNTPLPLTDLQPQAAPLCPKCGCAMLKRVSTKGNRAGQSFWGCSKFPNCHGTLSMNQQ